MRTFRQPGMQFVGRYLREKKWERKIGTCRRRQFRILPVVALNSSPCIPNEVFLRRHTNSAHLKLRERENEPGPRSAKVSSKCKLMQSRSGTGTLMPIQRRIYNSYARELKFGRDNERPYGRILGLRSNLAIAMKISYLFPIKGHVDWLKTNLAYHFRRDEENEELNCEDRDPQSLSPSSRVLRRNSRFLERSRVSTLSPLLFEAKLGHLKSWRL